MVAKLPVLNSDMCPVKPGNAGSFCYLRKGHKDAERVKKSCKHSVKLLVTKVGHPKKKC